jgi:hypothetical protein
MTAITLEATSRDPVVEALLLRPSCQDLVTEALAKDREARRNDLSGFICALQIPLGELKQLLCSFSADQMLGFTRIDLSLLRTDL